MDKKSDKNKPHRQDETRLSPEDVRLLRHFLEDYAKKAENAEPTSPQKEEDFACTWEFAIGCAVGSLLYDYFLQ